MKIALLAPPWIAIPPLGYGGTERVVYQLAEGLVKKGHQVTLFATGDSQTSAKLAFCFEKALGNDWRIKQNPYLSLEHIYAFIKLAKKENFDIIHNHASYVPLFFLSLQNFNFVTTLHGPLDQELKKLKDKDDFLIDAKRRVLFLFRKTPFVSISNHQRKGMRELNYIRTVYNGVEIEKFPLGEGKGNYLAWLGRVTPKKGADIAIKVALRLGMPLKISAFVDPVEKDYFESVIKPLINQSKLIEFIGELKDDKEKAKFLGEALVTLYPIRWHEPFGIVMVESMVCGTPVIAFNKGSVPEIVEDGKTGYIVENEEEMIEKVKMVKKINRQYCRQSVSLRFSVEKMIEEYCKVYQMILEKK